MYPNISLPHLVWWKCCPPGFLFSLINRNRSEARQEIQAGLYWGPCCSRGEWEQTTGPLLACSLRRGASLFLIWGEGRGVSRDQAGGVALVACPPLRWWCVQGACAVPCISSQPPAFAPGSSKAAVGFFRLFVFCCPEFVPTAHACSYFFSPVEFLCVLWLEERCVRVPALQQRVPGPCLSQKCLYFSAGWVTARMKTTLPSVPRSQVWPLALHCEWHMRGSVVWLLKRKDMPFHSSCFIRTPGQNLDKVMNHLGPCRWGQKPTDGRAAR